MKKSKYFSVNFYHTYLIILIGIIKIAYPINLSEQDSLRMRIYQEIETSNFNWNIAGDMFGENPNILSELDFKNLLSTGTGIELSYKHTNSLDCQLLIHFISSRIMDGPAVKDIPSTVS